jgi:hypothetical protein
LFGLALMILGFSLIFITIKSQSLTITILTSSILVIIIGFAMLLIGNYLLNSIFGLLC